MGLLIQWCSQCLLFIRGTILPETSIAPENWPSRKEIHLSTINFQGLDALVSGMVFHRFLGPPSPTREAKDPETQGRDKLVLLLQAYARPPPRESLPSSLTGRGCGVWVFFVGGMKKYEVPLVCFDCGLKQRVVAIMKAFNTFRSKIVKLEDTI